MTHIYILTPVPEMLSNCITPAFMISAMNLMEMTKEAGYQVTLRFDYMPGYDIARNRLVELALQGGADHLFWLDSDTLVPPDTILRLLEHDKPIVAGLYASRRGDLKAIAHLKTGVDENDIKQAEIVEDIPQKTFTVYSTGMGCVLMSKYVFATLAEKVPDIIEVSGTTIRFRFPQGDRTQYNFFKTIDLPTRTRTSEDVFFFDMIDEFTGYQVHIDPSIKVDHIGTGIATQENGKLEWTRI